MLSRWNSCHQLKGEPRIAGKKQHFGVLGMRVLVINRRLKEEPGRLQVRDKHDINISMLQLAEGDPEPGGSSWAAAKASRR
jgi:hypothetical protein